MTWCPFNESEKNLPGYKYFFRREEVGRLMGHPQNLEEWLHEVCPENYCYVWIWKNIYETSGSNQNGIVDEALGVPENVAVSLKLMSGADILNLDDYVIRGGYDRRGYRMERACPRD